MHVGIVNCDMLIKTYITQARGQYFKTVNVQDPRESALWRLHDLTIRDTKIASNVQLWVFCLLRGKFDSLPSCIQISSIHKIDLLLLTVVQSNYVFFQLIIGPSLLAVDSDY